MQAHLSGPLLAYLVIVAVAICICAAIAVTVANYEKGRHFDE